MLCKFGNRIKNKAATNENMVFREMTSFSKTISGGQSENGIAIDHAYLAYSY